MARVRRFAAIALATGLAEIAIVAFVAHRDRAQDQDRVARRLASAAFCVLCKTGTAAQVRAAIGSGVDVNARGPIGWTPLMEAASSNPSPEVVAELLRAGADVNVEATTFDDTPLSLAADHNKSAEVAGLLVRAGANVNFRSVLDETPLYRAAGNNTAEVVAVLVRAGANVNAKGFEGETPLEAAAAKNPNHGVIVVLLNAGADVGVDGGAPLRSAAAVRDVDMAAITAMIGAGAIVDRRDGRGRTALLESADDGNLTPALLAVLLRAGADVNARDDDGQTPLIRYADAGNDTNVISALIAAGADLSARDKDGKTALAHARRELGWHPAIAAALERAGAR